MNPHLQAALQWVKENPRALIDKNYYTPLERFFLGKLVGPFDGPLFTSEQMNKALIRISNEYSEPFGGDFTYIYRVLSVRRVTNYSVGFSFNTI